MIYYLLKLLSRILKIFYRIEVEGLENLPLEGKAILAANHTSFLDPVLLFCVIPRRLHPVTAKWLFKIWWLGWVFRGTSCVSTNDASKGAVAVLNRGKVLLIFPEGGCRRPGNNIVDRLHKGVAVFALKAGAPVIPVYIRGTHEAWPPSRKLPRLFMPLKIFIGKPLSFPKINDEIVPKEYLDETLGKIMKSIKALAV